MSINEIRNNIDNLEQKTKEELIDNVHELLIHEKKQKNKIASLHSEIKFLNRHLKKVRDLIDKAMKANQQSEQVWKK